MKVELETNEQIIKEGSASLQRGVETVGGKLYLTNDRLVFESHALNIQTGVTAVALGDVTQTTLCWTRFLNLFPLVPNSLAITTAQGNEYRFVLFGRASWKHAIDSQRTEGV